MNLYICSTYYHVYVALLKHFACREKQDTDLVICDDIPAGEQLVNRIRKASLFGNVWFVRQRELPQVSSKNWVDAVFSQHKRRAATLRRLLPLSIWDYQNIYIFHDGTPLGSYLNDEKCPYHLLEDSLNFYQYVYQSSQAHLLRPHNFRYFVRRLLKTGYFPLGESPYLLDIEVNDQNNIQIPSRKVIERPRAELEKQLTPDQIQLIFEVFGYHEQVLSGQKNAIILTEPLYQDNHCQTQEAQHEIYRTIVEYLLEKGLYVHIKPHPRDTIDYSEYPVVVIDRNFPSELFKLNCAIAFEHAVAVSSSSLLTFPAKHKYYWDIASNTPKNQAAERIDNQT